MGLGFRVSRAHCSALLCLLLPQGRLLQGAAGVGRPRVGGQQPPAPRGALSGGGGGHCRRPAAALLLLLGELHWPVVLQAGPPALDLRSAEVEGLLVVFVKRHAAWEALLYVYFDQSDCCLAMCDLQSQAKAMRADGGGTTCAAQRGAAAIQIVTAYYCIPATYGVCRHSEIPLCTARRRHGGIFAKPGEGAQLLHLVRQSAAQQCKNAGLQWPAAAPPLHSPADDTGRRCCRLPFTLPPLFACPPACSLSLMEVPVARLPCCHYFCT